MNIRMLLFFSLCFSGISLLGMQKLEKPMKDRNSQYHYRRAKATDLSALLELINTQAIHDSTKIVILPIIFRASSLKSALEKKRIFVAVDQNRIIGYKKLFIITSDSEKSDILNDEIRCINNEQGCTFAGLINSDGILIANDSNLLHASYSICIYNGGDFTLPSYRGKGVNQQLTNMALRSLIKDVKEQIQGQEVNSITMLYGVTNANAGLYPGESSDRTLSISKSFTVFIQELEENSQEPITLQHRRYRAFMPTFDPESQILKPLPDERSIPGFGCVLTYKLRKEHE